MFHCQVLWKKTYFSIYNETSFKGKMLEQILYVSEKKGLK